MKKEEYMMRVPISKDNMCIYRDIDKCTRCGACKGICSSRIGVYGHYDMKRSNPMCIYCGQCSLICPNNSIREVEQYKVVKKAIKKGRTVIAQIAPATRFLIGDEFGYPVGKNVVNKLISGLKKLGFSYVFDTTYGADLTICEEGEEFLSRLRSNSNLPMFTSCCPAWVKYCSEFYPEYMKNLSTCKSPILMMGSIVKNYYAPREEMDKPLVVAIVPCTAKKYEVSLGNDVDYALTVREVAKWFREERIDFRHLENSRFDDFTGTASGMIFGASGGVMEAVLRYVYHKLTLRNPPKRLMNLEEVRGLDDVKEASIKIRDYEINVAVINGTGDVPRVIEEIEKNNKHYDFIEVMACDGGCIAGGGGSKVNRSLNVNKDKRIKAVYRKGEEIKRKNSYENPKVKKVYKEMLGKPNSGEAHKLLHVKEDKNDEDE